MADTFDDLLQSLDDLQTTAARGPSVPSSYEEPSYSARESFNFNDLEPANVYDSEPERLSFQQEPESDRRSYLQDDEPQIYVPPPPVVDHEEVYLPPPKSSFQSSSSAAPFKSSFQSTSRNAPPSSYDPPQSSYEPPQSSYQPPQSSYKPPQSTYQPPQSSKMFQQPQVDKERSGDMRKFQRESVYVPKGVSSTSSTDRCAKCGEGIFGEHLTALGRGWHPNHFNCAGCGTELRGPFYDHHGQPHCTNCIGNMMPCSKCKRGITNQYVIQEGRPFHTDCIDRHRCARCNNTITETVLTANGQHWHPRCFSCHTCGRELSGTYIQNQGKPICEPCATQNRPVCTVCSQPLSGEFVSFDGKGFHQNCFTCSRCRNRLDLGGFFSVGGAYRCSNCK